MFFFFLTFSFQDAMIKKKNNLQFLLPCVVMASEYADLNLNSSIVPDR